MEALGFQPRLVTGDPTNLKITYPDDLTLAEAIMAASGAPEVDRRTTGDSRPRSVVGGAGLRAGDAIARRASG